MGCQSTYVPPITIPTGLTGGPGPAATDGVDGTSILINSSGASSSTGDQPIVSGTLTGGVASAGDVLDYEAYCSFTTSYVGSVYFKFGTTTILTHTIGVDDIYTPPVGETNFALILRGRVKFITTATENYVSSIEAIEDTVTKVTNPIANCSEDSASNITMSIRCNPTAGTMTCSYFTVTQSKKV